MWDNNSEEDNDHAIFIASTRDFMMDSIEDAKERRSGKNSMNKDYANKVNDKRIKHGIRPLKENCYPADNSSNEHIEKITAGLNIEVIK